MIATEPELIAARPHLRGVIHRYAAVASAAAFTVLVASAPDAAAAAWVAVYGTCVTLMLTVSAVYHSRRRASSERQVLKRLDHSMILVAIAGSYTGIVGLGVEGSERSTLLVVVWALAAAGVAIRLLWLHAPYPLTAAVYVAVGWTALLDVDALQQGLTAVELALVVAGGVLYSVGAIVYALHRPNPWPERFGYHEVFHGLVVAAATTHLAAVVLLLQHRPG